MFEERFEKDFLHAVDRLSEHPKWGDEIQQIVDQVLAEHRMDIKLTVQSVSADYEHPGLYRITFSPRASLTVVNLGEQDFEITVREAIERLLLDGNLTAS